MGKTEVNDIHINTAGGILFIKQHVYSNIIRQWLSLAVCFIRFGARTAVCMPPIVVHTFKSMLELFLHIIEPLRG